MFEMCVPPLTFQNGNTSTAEILIKMVHLHTYGGL